MTINVKISLCKITRASKLFQRNYYLPLLRPLSPKDAARRKQITGLNVLGSRYEHYIPVFRTQDEKTREKRQRPKGAPVIKKKVRMKENERYVAPFFDDAMENHSYFQGVLARKGKEKGQFYMYEIPDKNYNLVISNLLEKAIKEKDVIDVMIAQRSEKIIIKLMNGRRIALPLAKFDGKGVVYRGSGWTKAIVEEEHHHGKETMGMAKIFELKEAGIEDWELEMMRMASKRKKRVKGEENPDWNVVMEAAAENMDWDQFEEESKEILEQVVETVEEENIPMAVEDMSKTKNVNDRLKEAGEDMLSQLPTMKEIPEVIKKLESGEVCELEGICGAVVILEDAKVCFVVGQMIKTEDDEVFMPGQTVTTVDEEDAENVISEYVPGITVLMDDEPMLIPGLVFGEEEQTPTFLPGESAITEDGQLQFEATEEDRPPPKEPTPPPSPPKEPTPPPPSPPPIPIKREPTPPRKVQILTPEHPLLEDRLVLYEKRRKEAEELERKRSKERLEERMLKAESRVDTIRYNVRMKLRNFAVEMPDRYRPLEPVLKSKNLEDLERSIENGSFEDASTKAILERVRNNSRQCRVKALLCSYGLDGEYGSGFFGPAAAEF